MFLRLVAALAFAAILVIASTGSCLDAYGCVDKPAVEKKDTAAANDGGGAMDPNGAKKTRRSACLDPNG